MQTRLILTFFLNTGSNSQATSCSNWSQECKFSREIFKEAMESLSSCQFTPLKTQPSQHLAVLLETFIFDRQHQL